MIGLDITGTTALGNGYCGIYILSANGNFIGADANGVAEPTLRNVISGNTWDGIKIDGGQNNVVAGNFLGVDTTGEHALGNVESGISLTKGPASTGASHNRVGGTDANSRNIISGNGVYGLYIGDSTMSSANLIQGNFFGLDQAGILALGNGNSGIYDYFAQSFIGTDAGGNAVPGSGNVIAGNGNDGITLDHANNTVVDGNLIGTDASGIRSIGNADSGVYVTASSYVNIGTLQAASNLGLSQVIAGGKKAGITLDGASQTSIDGNYIGTDRLTKANLGNPIGIKIINGSTNNSIGVNGANHVFFNTYSGVAVFDSASVRNTVVGNAMVNFGPSIDLGGNGVTPNTPGGPHVGPNQALNTPILTFSANGSLGITMNAAPSTLYKIDYYASAPFSPLHGPQAQVHLGQASLTTDATGNSALIISYTPIAGLTNLSATATDSSGNTSELSGLPDPNPVKAAAVPAIFTATAPNTPVLATFNDLDPRSTAGRFASGIVWGDGSAPSPGVVRPATLGFQVLASHTYAHSGSYTAFVVIVDTVLNITTTTATSVQVAPVPIVAQGSSYVFSGKAATFSNIVATFSDAGPALPPNSYAAIVSWGDGTVSAGKINGGNGSFVVKASHKFTRFSGVRTATVTITDASGRRATITDPFSFKGK